MRWWVWLLFGSSGSRLNGGGMSIWSGATLSEELPRLVSPFNAKQIDCAAYTLRIGEEVYVSPWNKEEALTRTRRTLAERQGFVIPAGQLAFVLTEEIVEVPSYALAFISMKARIKFRGLVNVSGFHVDPGYKGRLVFAVFNAGPSAVHLARGDECFLIWYASLDRDSRYYREGAAIDSITSDILTPIAGAVQSLAGLSGRMDAVEAEHRRLRDVATIAVGIGVGLLGAILATLLAGG